MIVAVPESTGSAAVSGTAFRIDITVAPQTAGAAVGARIAEPTTMGVPFPRGACVDPQSLLLLDAHGNPQPLQARALDRWPDGSVRWALLDFQADAEDSPARYAVVPGQPAVTALPGLSVRASDQGVVVDTGAARFSLRPSASFPFDEVSLGARPLIDPERTSLVITDASGTTLGVQIDRITVEEHGPVRAVVLCQGSVQAPDATVRLDLIARLHFFARSATVRVALTLRNPQPAGHDGGRWTLGGTGSVYLRDVSLSIAFAGAGGPSRVHCSPELSSAYRPCEAPFELYQDSSGGECWRSANHVNRDGRVPFQFQGYRLREGTIERDGRRASPVVSVSRGDQTMSVAMPRFWQNFPKAVEAGPDGLTLRLFPRQTADVHELQGGEQKTHTFLIAFDHDRVTSVPLDWCRSPLLARSEPSWYCATGAVSYLVPIAGDPNRDHIGLAHSAIEGDHTFEHKRERIDDYGWRHFGDVYADHEAVFQRDSAPLISHYNNQYDAIAGFAFWFLRSGDSRWWTLMEELASHVVDIDMYHTDGDKAAYNHGLFWHTFHYVDAGTSAHRSYPRHPQVGGGGPSAEHNYSTGLLLHYFLTGEAQSRDAAIELAQWVVDMDDGRQTPFRWLARGATGLASASGSASYHGPGRGGGNSIVALLNGHRATGDARFLSKAEALIRRSIHPADDIGARNLPDAERRWYYTVFLQALGKYLDDKAERGALDRMYAYARASLLHYAAWMAEHEYPYLDHPDILEYPTETWAAQDMRKSDVMSLAARHSNGADRSRFLERSDYFFRVSVSTLARMPTRTLARPVTLMLTNGLMHAWIAQQADIDTPAPAGSHDFGEPERFVPQKARAMRRAAWLAAAAVIAGAGSLLLFLLR